MIKIFFCSLGCDKNLVDSEMMLGSLKSAGFELTDSEEEADVAVVNTCCFIHDAKEESIQTLLELAEYKKTGRLKLLIATGCLAQRYSNEIKDEMPEVDSIIGTTATDELISVIKDGLVGKKECVLKDINLPVHTNDRILTTGGVYAYLKIAEGCNKCCTYCVIPKIRGNYRSVPMDELVSDAEKLAAGGVKELILIAQETTVYGIDLYGRKMLPELLKKLCKIENIEWIRVLYCYPEEITDEFIDVMSSEKKICNYIDMPIQHASDDILKRMGRKTNKKEITERIKEIRRKIPDITIRTSLITGFPGETEDDFNELYSFVKDTEFNRLGVFTYSKEEDTPAARMKQQIKKSIKISRKNAIMELQQNIAFEAAKKNIGRKMRVLIEGCIPEDEVYVGRTYMDAPGVDGYVFISGNKGELISGEFANVVITGAKGYDLVARFEPD